MANCCPDNWIKLFKAIADKHRQSIINVIIKHQPVNATQILKHIKLSQPTLSHHLNKLNDANVLQTKKIGKEVFYSINTKIVSECCCGFADKVNQKES